MEIPRPLIFSRHSAVELPALRSRAGGLLVCAGLLLTSGCEKAPAPPSISADAQPQAEAAVRVGGRLASPEGIENAKAAVLAASAAPGEERMQRLHPAFVLWIAQDADAALEWLASLNNDRDREALIRAAVDALGDRDPTRALELASRVEEDGLRQELLELAGLRWAEVRPEDAAAWADGLREEGDRNAVMFRVALGWAQRSPERAAAYVATAFPPGQMQDDAALNVARRWATETPDKAAAWALSFADGGIRERTLRVVMEEWVFANKDATAFWVQSLDAGPLRDAAQGAWAQALRESHPAEAAAGAAAIGDDTLREMQLGEIIKGWRARDASAAAAWVQSAALPAPLKERLSSD